MNQDRSRSLTRSTLAGAAALLVGFAPAQQVLASQNNSGRYVVAGEDGVWRAVEANTDDSVFYPSWYLGLDVSQSHWESDSFESKSTGAGVVVGNHFNPHLRWELRHRYQQPETKYSDVAGEDHTLSSLSLDYLVSEPKDGFSPVIRGGVARADGDGFEDEQSDAMALLGLGVQWREDRWTVRMLVEQAGEDLTWGGLTIAAYVGGNASSAAHAYSTEAAVLPVEEPQEELEIQPVEPEPAVIADAPDAEPVVVVVEVVETPVPVGVAPKMVVTQCGEVFSTRVMNDVTFANSRSDKLTARSVQQLSQIGASYARRSYVAVEAYVSAPDAGLAERRAASVIVALNTSGELDGRVSTRATAGADALLLSMQDMRHCK